MISIIIPTFNRLRWLKKCLQQLNNQVYDGRYEVIVIDDGSNDGTGDYLRLNKAAFRFSILLLLQKNKGPAAARNYGIRKAKGNIIALLDDDSIAEPNWLEEISTSFQELPRDCAVVKGKTKMYGYSDLGAFLQNNFDDSDSWITNNIAYRKEILCKVGLFDEMNFSLAAWEDLDLGYRIQRAGYKRFYNPKAIIYHPRQETIQQLKNKFRINGYGFYQFVKKWMYLDPTYVTKLIFWKITHIYYMIPFIRHINYKKYIEGLRLAYEINGIIQGIKLRGNFKIITRDRLNS